MTDSNAIDDSPIVKLQCCSPPRNNNDHQLKCTPEKTVMKPALKYIAPALILLALFLLASCGGSTSEPNPAPGGGTGGTGGGTGGGGGGGTGSGSSPSQTTFIYGTSGEAIDGAQLSSTGQLTALSMPMDQVSGNLGWLPGTGGLITSLAADPQGRFLYALSISTSSFGIPIGKNGLTAFTINRTTGALSMVGSPLDVPSRGGNLAVTGDGQRLVLASNGSVSIYNIDPATGSLSQPTSTTALGEQIQTSWDGQFIYTSSSNGRISSYKIAADGSATEVNHVDVQNADNLFLSHSGKFLYSFGGAGISVLSVSAAGQLAVVQADFPGWQLITSTQDDRLVFLSNQGDGTTPGVIRGFQTDPGTGVIGAAVGNPVTLVNDFAYQISTDYSSRFLLVATAGAQMISYQIGSDGNLTNPMTVQGAFIGPQFFVQVP
jgi:6-phosphogluconolactonase (cycloisomerase 2 family)